jgi:hypothetical protein
MFLMAFRNAGEHRVRQARNRTRPRPRNAVVPSFHERPRICFLPATAFIAQTTKSRTRTSTKNPRETRRVARAVAQRRSALRSRPVRSTPTGRSQLLIDLFLPMADALFVKSGMACAPPPHLSEDRLQAFTALGKRILHFWRNHFIDLPPN